MKPGTQRNPKTRRYRGFFTPTRRVSPVPVLDRGQILDFEEDPMKDQLFEVARYNKAANEAMLAIVEALPRELLRKDVGIHYKSVLG